MAPVTGASSLQGFRNAVPRASYTDEAQRLVKRPAGMGLKGIGIVYQDNEHGKEALADAQRTLDGLGMKPAVEAAVATDGLNLSAVFTKVAAGRPSSCCWYRRCRVGRSGTRHEEACARRVGGPVGHHARRRAAQARRRRQRFGADHDRARPEPSAPATRARLNVPLSAMGPTTSFRRR